MPAGSAAALICDTGDLIDYLVESAPDQRLFRKAIDTRALATFRVARGAFTYAPPTVGQPSRAMEVDRRFANLGLGLADGSVVALAESLGIRRLATRDVRHFAAVRLRDGRGFDLVVHPTDADRS